MNTVNRENQGEDHFPYGNSGGTSSIKLSVKEKLAQKFAQDYNGQTPQSFLLAVTRNPNLANILPQKNAEAKAAVEGVEVGRGSQTAW